MIEISKTAQGYLRDLLAKQEHRDVGIRVFVSQPGTPQAETCIAYCRPGEEQSGRHPGGVRRVHRVDREAQRAVPGRRRRRLPGRSDGRPTDDQGAERARAECRPRRADRRPHQLRALQRDQSGLASHGGQVTLLEVVDGNTAVLQFGGGCQGCSAVDITLKQGVERSLLAQIPELVAIRDSTDHSVREHAYYQ